MRVLFLIPKAKAPTLEGSNFSHSFKDFVGLCLIKDPSQRPSAKELLQHRFVKYATAGSGSKKANVLMDLIERHRSWKSNKTASAATTAGPKDGKKNGAPSDQSQLQQGKKVVSPSDEQIEKTLIMDETLKPNDTLISAWSFDTIRQDMLDLEEDQEEIEADDETYHRKLSEAMRSMALTQQNLVGIIPCGATSV